MLSKLFDCRLDDGHPTVRIPVDVPESAAEVLALLAPEHLQSLTEAVLTDDPGHNLALAHEEQRVEVLGKLFDQEKALWEREHARLKAAAADEPLPGPQTFEAAFPEIFARKGFAARFAKADAKAEYFRLYSLLKSTATFTAIEAAADHPAPEAEHKNWTKIRSQKGLVGTERKAAGRQALLALKKNESETPEEESSQSE